MDTPTNFLAAAQALNNELRNEIGPPEEGLIAGKGGIIPIALTRGTRGYIEKVVNQVNGAYQNGWYDACSVMLRRLLETLIIETFEAHNIGDKIKNPQGDFLYLRDLIDRTVSEPAWNLGRNTRSALPKLKDLGDKSAHSRRYNAVRDDLEKVQADVRLVVQELLSIAGLK